MSLVDLRSDTVTLPSPQMRAAMAAADIGDDVYGEDPTVNRLEARAAELLGKEAAVFVPSGTMGNLMAVLSHTRSGDEVICGRATHTFANEGGGSSRFGGVSFFTIGHERGRIDPREVAAAVHPSDPHYPRSRLLIVEQPSRGWVIPLDLLQAATDTARSHGLAVHMDGARLFNAAVALGVPARQIADAADTVMTCLSKGLAAPVGSLLLGPAPLIAEARRHRKALGGGMRQAGTIAAAGLVALETMVDRLAEDHAHARRLAAGLVELGWTLDRQQVETNIFWAQPPHSLDTAELVQALKDENILVASPYSGRTVRMVTHYGITAADVDRVLAVVSRASRPLAVV